MEEMNPAESIWQWAAIIRFLIPDSCDSNECMLLTVEKRTDGQTISMIRANIIALLATNHNMIKDDCSDYNFLDVVSHLSLSQTKQFILMQLLIICEKGFIPRALLTISHHDKHKAKSV